MKRVFQKLMIGILVFILLIPAMPSMEIHAAAPVYEHYRKNLDANEKRIYDTLYKKYKKGWSGKRTDYITVKLPKVRKWKNVKLKQGKINANTQKKIDTYIESAYDVALEALSLDHPEIPWVTYNAVWSKAYGNKYKIKKNGSRATVTLSSVTIRISRMNNANKKINSKSAKNIVQSRLKQLNKGVKGEQGRYKKVLAIYKTVVQQLRYEKDALLKNNKMDVYQRMLYSTMWPAVAASNGKSEGGAFCIGYAMVFKALCDKNGIPCVIVEGNAVGSDVGHAWNYVKMDDGKWYLVDATWDDSEENGAKYNYFLVGSNTKYNGKALSECRTPKKTLAGVKNKTYKLPKLSNERYDAKAEPAGSVIAVEGSSYVVTDSAKKQVEFVSTTVDGKLVIPASVTYECVSYDVVSIKERAVYSNTKITEIDIGENVEFIGREAFKNCCNVKKVMMRTLILKSETVGEDAFKGFAEGLVLCYGSETTSEFRKAYCAMLKEKGLYS